MMNHNAYADNNHFDLHPFASTEEAERFQLLTKQIRCVVCQNQSIAESDAPLAHDLREKIYHMILDKKNDDSIKEYLVKRYGEFILLQPPFNKLTVVLWLFPFGIMMLMGLFFRALRK
ncbi:MAG: cytochrome c-type biogenesis protein CcmH [Gammaproteobacteria bacterium]|nr:cytochrome c-type biogenesis protein CcmH [Gammaproteobacteria bacterium]